MITARNTRRMSPFDSEEKVDEEMCRIASHMSRETKIGKMIIRLLQIGSEELHIPGELVVTELLCNEANETITAEPDDDAM